jgi:hypothetical protein
VTEANFRLVKADVYPLTKELAEKFSTLEASPTERDLNPARLHYLEKQAAEGRLITFQWATAKLGERVFRMNGQHSSTMLCGLNGSFPSDLMVHWDEYEVDNEYGLASLFRQFDARKSSRTPSDVAGAYQGLVPELRQLNKATAKLGVEGINWYLRTIEGAPVESGDDQYMLFYTPAYHSFLRWLDGLISIKTPELKNKFVASAMYATFIANGVEAQRFWDEVARGGAEFDETAPSTKLDNWLKQVKERTDRKRPKPAQFYQGCIYAWNAFRMGKTISDIRADARKGLFSPIE